MSFINIIGMALGSLGILKAGSNLKKAMDIKAKKIQDANVPIDCVPGVWDTESSECSTQNCDGVRTIRRIGDTGNGYGKLCAPNEFQIPCNGPDCTEQCLLNPWGDWSTCSTTEGGVDINLSCDGPVTGKRYRYRSIFLDGPDCPPEADMTRKQFAPCARSNNCPFINNFYGTIKVVPDSAFDDNANSPSFLGDYSKTGVKIDSKGLDKSSLYTNTGTSGSDYELIGKFDGSLMLRGRTITEGNAVYANAFNHSGLGQPYGWTISKHPTNSKYLRFVGLGKIDPTLQPLGFSVELS